MKNALSRNEAYDLLKNFIYYRDKLQKNNHHNTRKKYNQYLHKCVMAFDYIVIMKTNRYKNFANHEDLMQDGRMGLLLALNSYDLKKGDFFWWAHKYIGTRISRCANNHSTIKIPIKKAKDMLPYKVSQMPVLIDDENIYDYINIEEEKDKVIRALEILSDRERKIIEMSFGLNGIRQHSVSNISKVVGLSEGTCSKILNQAKQNLKPILENLID